jgi:hypothetical protein
MKIVYLVAASILYSSQVADAAGIDLKINGVDQTFLDASLVQFNLTLFQFGGPRQDNPNDSILKFSTSGDKETFQFIATGGPVEQTRSLDVKGVFGETKTEGGNNFVSNPWWDFNFTFNLKHREAAEDNLTRLDEVSVVNGIIQHLEDPHPGDNEEGLDLVWGDLSIVANAWRVGGDGIRKNNLASLDREPHRPIPHQDRITEGTLSGKVVDGIFGDDFESWRMVAKAEHVGAMPPPPPDVPDVPEPHTIAMLAISGAVLAWRRRKVAPDSRFCDGVARLARLTRHESMFSYVTPARPILVVEPRGSRGRAMFRREHREIDGLRLRRREAECTVESIITSLQGTLEFIREQQRDPKVVAHRLREIAS